MTKEKMTKDLKKKNGQKQIQPSVSERAAKAILATQDKDFLENGPKKDQGNRNQTGLPQQKNRLCFFINSQTKVRA